MSSRAWKLQFTRNFDKTLALLLAALLSIPASAFALPQGFEVISGDVTFSQPDANTLNVTSSSMQSIVQYQAFDVASGQTVNFFLPSTQAMILNQILGGSASTIMGNINSNGQVILVNPAGIRIGETGQINVGALVASTLNISNQDFLQHQLTFKRLGEQASASVENIGSIETLPGGFVVLSGGAVANSGNINTPMGAAHLAVGDQVSIQMGEGVKVQVQVDESLKQKVEGYNDAITNAGKILVDGGLVKLQADLADNLYARAINNTGSVKAQSAILNGKGEIEFIAKQDTVPAMLVNSGEVNASGVDGAADAGRILLSAGQVIQGGKVLSESASNGTGGDILITSAQQTDLEAGSVTSVRGNGENGQGGNLKIWSDGNTDFKPSGLIDLRGGDISGDAGFAEISAKDTVRLGGLALGEARLGKAGGILIDPLNIIIQGGGTNPGSGTVAYTTSAGSTQTYDPSFFSGFATVNLQATNDITIADHFNLPSTTSFTLSANNDINIQKTLTVGTSSTASTVTLTADAANGASADGVGNINLTSTGSIVKLGTGAITLQGNNITLDGALNLGSGGLTLRATNDLNLNNSITTSGNAAMTMTADYNNGTSVPSNGAGHFNLNSTGSINKPGSGTLTLQGTDVNQNGAIAAGTGVVTINASNNVNILNSLSSTAGANPAWTIKADANLTGAPTDGVGTVYVSSTGSISKQGTGGLTITAASIDLDNTVDSGTGNISFQTSQAGRAIEVGGGTSTADSEPGGALSISNPELALLPITNNITTIGTTTNTAGLTVVGPVVTNRQLNLTNGGPLVTNAGGTITSTNRQVVLTSDTIDINDTIDTGTANTIFQTATPSRNMELGATGLLGDPEPGSALSISAPELALINAGGITMGQRTNTSTLTLLGAINRSSALTLNSSSFVQNVGSTINLTAGKTVTIYADTIDINDTITSDTAGISIGPSTASRNVQVGGNALLTDLEPSNVCEISNAEIALLNNTGSSWLTLGNYYNTSGTTTLLNALSLGNRYVAIGAGGTLIVPAGTGIDTSAFNRNISLFGDTIDLDEVLNAGSGNITLNQGTSTRNVEIGGSASLSDPEPVGVLGISNAEIGLLNTTGTITFGANSIATGVITGTTTLLNALSSNLTGNWQVALAGGTVLIPVGTGIDTSAYNKTINLYADVIDIDEILNAGSGSIGLFQGTVARNVEVGGGNSLADAEPGTVMNISNPELALLNTTGTLTIGRQAIGGTVTTGSLTLLNNLALGNKAVTLATGGALYIPAGTGVNTSAYNRGIVLAGDTIDIDEALNAGTSSITLGPGTIARNIEIGGGVSLADAEPGNVMRVSNQELALLTAGTISLGSRSTSIGNTTGSVTLLNALSLGNTHVTLATGAGSIQIPTGTGIDTSAFNKNITIYGDTQDINAALSSGSGTISLYQGTISRNVEIGGGINLTDAEPTATAMRISNPELALLNTTSTLNIGASNFGGTLTTGTLSLLSNITPGNKQLVIASGAGLLVPSGTGIDTSAFNKTFTLTADTLDIDGALNAGTGSINLYTAAGARNIEIGGGVNLSDAEPTATAMRISNPELALMTAGTINIGNDNTGTMNVIGTTSLSNSNLTLYNRNLITVNASSPITLGGSKTLTLKANDLDIFSTINVGTSGVLSILSRDATRPFNLGGSAAVAGALRVTDAEFAQLTGGTINFGTGVGYTSGLTVSGDINTNSNLGFYNTGTSGTYTAITQDAGTTINTNGKNLTIQGNTVDLNGIISAGSGTVTISPSSNTRPVTLADATSGNVNEVSFTDLNLSAQELSAISAGALVVGTTANTGGLTVAGDFDLSNRFNISLSNAGGISATDRFLNTGGTKTISLNAVNSTLNWTTAGDNRPILLNTVTANGGTTLTTTGNNSAISAASLSSTGGTGLIISTAGSNSDVTLSSLTSFGTNNVNVLLDALQSNLTIGSAFTHNGTGANTVRLNAGFSTDGDTLNNANAILSLAAGSTVANGATKNWSMYTGGGSAFNTSSLFNRAFNFNNLDFRTGGANTGLDFSLASMSSATSLTANSLILRALGTGSPIQVGGTLNVTGNMDILAAASDTTLNGDIASSGTAGTYTRLAAGYNPEGSLVNAAAVLTLGPGAVNITNNAGKTLSVWTGAGSPFANSYFNNTQTFDTLDLRAGGTVDIGSAGTPLHTTVNNLIVQSGGNASVTNSGTALILGKNGANNQTAVTGTLTVSNNQGVSTANTVSGGAISLTTTAGNSNITLNDDISATSAVNLTTDGTGVLSMATGADLTVNNGAISVLARNIDMQGTSTMNAGTGTISLNPNASGLTYRFGDAGVGTGDFDLNAAEMERITAGTLTLGSTGITGGLTQAGNMDISGRYHLELANQTGINTNGYTITAGTRNLTLNTPGTINLGTVNGSTSIVTAHAGSGLTVSGPIVLSGAGSVSMDTSNNGHILVNADITGGTSTSLASNGTGNILLATGSEITNTNGAISLTGNNITLQGASTLNAGTAGTVNLRANGNKEMKVADNADADGDDATFDINAAELSRITAGNLLIGNTAESGGMTLMGDIDLSGRYNLTLANGGDITGTNVSLLRGGKTLSLSTPGQVTLSDTGVDRGYNISGINAAGLSMITDGANSGISLGGDYSGSSVLLKTLGGNSAINTGNLTASSSNLTVQALGSGNTITIGHVSAASNLDLLSPDGNLTTGNVVANGGSGTTVRLAAGYDASGTLVNSAASILMPGNAALSIASNANKNVQLWDGQGSIFSQNLLTSAPTLNLLDLRTNGNMNFGTAGSPLALAVSQLLIQTQGGADVDNTGALTLGLNGAGNNVLANDALQVRSTGNLTIANQVDALTITLQTTANNGNLTVSGGNINASGNITLATHGSGSLIMNNSRSVTTTGGLIDVSASDMDLANGSLNTGPPGSITIKTADANAAMEFGNGLAGGAGSLKLDNTELAHLNSPNLIFGSNAGTGNFTFGNADFSLTNSHLTVLTAGSLLDGSANDALANIILAADRNLMISGNNDAGSGAIGTVGLGDLDVTLSGTGSLSARTNNAALTLETSGTFQITQIATGHGNVSLTAVGNITDTDTTDDGFANLLTTGKIELSTSGGSIGTANNPLDLDAATTANALKASAPNGNIFIREVSGALSLDDINASSANGTILLRAPSISLSGSTTTSHDLTLLTDQVTLDGNIHAAGGTVRLAPETASSLMRVGVAGGGYTLSAAQLSNIQADTIEVGSSQSTGNILLGSLNLNTNLTLNTSGNIIDASVGNDTTPNITLAADHNLKILGGVNGAGQVGDTTDVLDDLDVSLSGTGRLDVTTNNRPVYINLTTGGYLGLLDVGTAGFTLSAGDPALNTNGSILDSNGAALNIHAGSDSVLTAGNSVASTIGSSTDALEILMSGGKLSAQSSGTDNGVSINVSGTLANPLGFITTPPGHVVTTGIQLAQPPVTPATVPAVLPPFLFDTRQNPITTQSNSAQPSLMLSGANSRSSFSGGNSSTKEPLPGVESLLNLQGIVINQAPADTSLIPGKPPQPGSTKILYAPRKKILR